MKRQKLIAGLRALCCCTAPLTGVYTAEHPAKLTAAAAVPAAVPTAAKTTTTTTTTTAAALN